MKSLGKIGNSCTNDYFCRRAVLQSHCYNGKCTCFDGYRSIDQYTCMKSNDWLDFFSNKFRYEFSLKLAIDEETTSRSTPVPVDYKSLLGGKCITKRNCHTSNAMCVNSVCTCPKGHFPVDDWTCLREPGMRSKRFSFIRLESHYFRIIRWRTNWHNINHLDDNNDRNGSIINNNCFPLVAMVTDPNNATTVC